MKQESCHLYLVRHGETDWNCERKLQGLTDIPLNDKGRIQAKVLSEHFEDVTFDAVYSSDLMRAKETAEIITFGKGLPVMTTPNLRERYWGTYEGHNFDALKEKYGQKFHPIINDLSPDLNLLPEGLRQVETYTQALARLLPFLHEVKLKFKGKRVLIVSHGGILKGLLLYLNLREFKKPYIDNTAYIHLEAMDEHFHLRASHGVSCE